MERRPSRASTGRRTRRRDGPLDGATRLGYNAGVYRTAILAAGIFVTDPDLGYRAGVPEAQTTHGVIHGVAALTALTSNALACFVTAFAVRGDPRWQGWFGYSIVSGTLVVGS